MSEGHPSVFCRQLLVWGIGRSWVSVAVKSEGREKRTQKASLGEKQQNLSSVH